MPQGTHAAEDRSWSPRYCAAYSSASWWSNGLCATALTVTDAALVRKSHQGLSKATPAMPLPHPLRVPSCGPRPPRPSCLRPNRQSRPSSRLGWTNVERAAHVVVGRRMLVLRRQTVRRQHHPASRGSGQMNAAARYTCGLPKANAPPWIHTKVPSSRSFQVTTAPCHASSLTR